MLDYYTALGIVFLLVIAGHYFSWPRKLPRLVAYAGAQIIAWAGLWLYLPESEWRELVAFPIVMLSTDYACYLLDWILNQIVRAKLSDDRTELGTESDQTPT